MEKLTYTLEDLRGVGRVELELRPKERAYVFFGVNGVGKTKCLEGLFQGYFFPHCENTPTVFLGANQRGHIEVKPFKDELFGTFESRRKKYIDYITQGMRNGFASLGMDMGLEQWIVSIAHAANPYQAQEDNRSIEIETLIRLLHQVDSRFDPAFLTIDGNNNVSIKVDGVVTKIRDLSTGFASLLKIFQTIISGYGFFTNSTDLANVEGIVFIDEIESHLHVEWQSKIIPLLKKLFPNTTFYIATHSPIVLSQLQEGEAYRLEKQEDGVVRATIIEAPNKRILSDVLVDAMDVDLNALKRNRLVTEDQTEAKKGLLALLRASKAARQKEPA